jgi:hypothetical protein
MVAQLDHDYIRARPARGLARLASYALFEGRPLTTRGRWINPLLKAMGRNIAVRRWKSEIRKPIFILGTGRSGTTILGKILSLHREVGWLNEPKLMWHIACPDEDINGNYTDKPARYRLSANDVTDSTRQAMHNLYNAYLSCTRNSRVLDKYPELIFRIPFVKTIFPDAKFLLLVRNGYDTCSSIGNWSKKHESTSAYDNGQKEDWWGLDNRKWRCLMNELVQDNVGLSKVADQISKFNLQTDMAAIEWILSMQAGLQAIADNPDSFHMIHYEKLANYPADTLNSVLQYCELSPDKALIKYAAKTLRPARNHSAFAIHDSIAEQFKATMEQLGYD